MAPSTVFSPSGMRKCLARKASQAFSLHACPSIDVRRSRSTSSEARIMRDLQPARSCDAKSSPVEYFVWLAWGFLTLIEPVITRMPRRLLDRCRPDSIQEFRLAASRRFDDGLAMASQGRRTAAIYLWGYTGEMIIKAAYFSFLGIHDAQDLSWSIDVRPAIRAGRQLGILWPPHGEGHNVRAWGELLINARSTSAASAFPIAFGHDVQRHCQRIGQLWRETLRYRKNHAYLHEVNQVRVSAEWLLVHSHAL